MQDEETVVREVQTVENTESRAALEKSLTVMVASARNAGGIAQLRDTVETGVLGAAFLMTGQLASINNRESNLCSQLDMQLRIAIKLFDRNDVLTPRSGT